MLKVVLATANPDKAAEIAVLLDGALDEGIELLPRPPEVPDVVEDGDTLDANARLKARALVDGTGEAAVADDTGLEVDALGGAPGVFAARFAGERATYADNVAKLLGEMEGVEDRRARFRTVALLARPNGTEVVAEGILDGTIAPEARGDHGFGYDPVFIPDGSDGRTLAEMTPDEKNAISHRGRAFRALASKLAADQPPPL